MQFLRDLLARFVNPSAIKACSSPLEVPYQDLKNQKANEDLVLGCRTLSVAKGLRASKKQEFFSTVRKYFTVTCDYIRHKFSLKNETLNKAEVANLKFLNDASFTSLRFFVESFPQILPQGKNESRVEAFDALEGEFAELQAHRISEDILSEERIDVQWSEVGRITSVDEEVKFGRVSKMMLQLLAIPHSNAECERIFRMVKKGAPGCLKGVTLVVTGVLECIERDDAKELLERCGAKVTQSVSRNTTYLVAGRDSGPAKIRKCISIDGMEGPTPKTRVHHDAAFKRTVIGCAETDGNRAASRSFGVPETCVRDWRKQKQKIADSKASRKGFSEPQQGRFPQIKELLGEYVLEQQAAQQP
ncbi:hypothetical protein HPB51_021355 [Rhipicephalus microplus]|uniref:BRCT domain-containing protein n=1 Tax=Rhipicephalus microplus TaxID=6941 RepID=A0A9J6F801_RHIMP|nr:hypothetical protein HPB51_021355 [Rhipicephalus microplus]